jgi:hypothetical protein
VALAFAARQKNSVCMTHADDVRIQINGGHHIQMTNSKKCKHPVSVKKWDILDKIDAAKFSVNEIKRIGEI